MMNKNQSKKMNLAKLFFVFPLLALFLWSFNTKTVYEFKDSASSVTKVAGKSIELVIDMNTTDKELKQIKNDLAEDGIDFSYTVVHSDSDEIIDISIQVSGKGENGGTFKNSYNSSDNADGISPIVVYIDLENNLVSVGTKDSYTSNVIKTKSKSNSFWINSDDDNEKEIIEIRKSGDGEEVIKLNGKVITREELEKNDKYQHISVETEYNDEDNDHSSSKKIIVKSIGSNKGGEDGEDVFIINTDKSDDFSKSVKISSNSFFFVDSDGKEKPLYYIDGKKVSEKEMLALSAKQIESINVLKDKSATKKYGKKAKNGVIKITTKKEK